jgi:DNA adenine methylase
LIGLWDELINRPDALARAYAQLWHEQQGQERAYYDRVRDQFNQTQRAPYLLYLLARCVKAAVRYNANGQFNQSPDNRRQGTHPTTLRHHILGAAHLLKERTVLTTGDYRAVLDAVGCADLVYMDPPYQGVCGNRDPRYFAGLEFEGLIDTLQDMNRQGVSYILSYDGRTGAKQFGKPLPDSLRLRHIELDAGRSSQATLLGRSSRTYESLYLSPALVARQLPGAQRRSSVQQLALLEIPA